MAKSIGLHKRGQFDSYQIISERLQKTLLGLKKNNSTFNDWFLTRKPKKKETIKPIDSDNLSELEGIICRAANVNPDTKEVYKELGIELMLKNNISFKKSVALSLHWGSSNKWTDDIVLHSPLFENDMNLTEDEIQCIIDLFRDVWYSDWVEVR